MRSEKEVLQQLLRFASSHDSIRAVVMNGSRLNPKIENDLFSDYDIVYYAQNPFEFCENRDWIPNFGELVMLQANTSVHEIERCIFLMQFQDGVRIDLSYAPLSSLEFVFEDTLTAVLLDKDLRIPALLPPSDRGYYPPRPSQQDFDETINEILWCSGNVAKGIWRKELPYIKGMFDVVVRDALLKLLTWYAASLRSWEVNLGSYARWLEHYLPSDIWQSYVRTYTGIETDAVWNALFETLQLTQRTGTALAEELDASYPHTDHERMVGYLNRVRALPPDAVTFD